MIPAHVKYLIVGTGIHGLATAYHLAMALKASGRGSGEDVLVVDPYGADSPEFIVDDLFAETWCSALAFCQKRYEGLIGKWRQEPSGAFTADSIPVFDRFRENCYAIADSNHGYKMLAVGKLHPVSNSPFP